LIYELGIMHLRQVMLFRQYYPLTKKNPLATEERASFLQLMQELSPRIVTKQISSISIVHYQILFTAIMEATKDQTVPDQPFFYAICDYTIDVAIVLQLMEQLKNYVKLEYGNLPVDPEMDNKIIEQIKKKIDEILRDEPLTPIDRVKRSLFGN
jgi:hypothetical protein